jgi:hypothetical protein
VPYSRMERWNHTRSLYDAFDSDPVGSNPRAKKTTVKTGQDFVPYDRPIAVAIIGSSSLDAVSQRVIVHRDLPRLFAASDFQWRSVRYLDVHKTDEPTLR